MWECQDIKQEAEKIDNKTAIHWEDSIAGFFFISEIHSAKVTSVPRIVRIQPWEDDVQVFIFTPIIRQFAMFSGAKEEFN